MPALPSRGYRVILIRLFIVGFLALALIDGLPATGTYHQRAKDAVDPLLDAAGLWQNWQLFAPDVDKINVRVSAELLLDDGSTLRFRSPDWHLMPAWRRFLEFRHMEYFDNIRLDVNSGGWDGLASFLARTTPVPPGRSVDVVTLTREWAEVPPPQPATFVPAVPYVNFHGRFLFHTWKAP
jgi:hypothetical protein